VNRNEIVRNFSARRSDLLRDFDGHFRWLPTLLIRTGFVTATALAAATEAALRLFHHIQVQFGLVRRVRVRASSFGTGCLEGIG